MQKVKEYFLICDFEDLLNPPAATTLQKIRASGGPMKLVLLSAHEWKFVASFLPLTAHDVIIDRALLWDEFVVKFKQLISPDDTQAQIVQNPPVFRLTKRQVQILRLSSAGNNNRKIAEILNLSENTIKVHAWRLYKQIGAKNRLDAIAKARAQGYL